MPAAWVMQNEESRTEVALYWSAVSLIVCEGLSIAKAARRLGLPASELREILKCRTQALLGADVDADVDEPPSDEPPPDPPRPRIAYYDYPPTRPLSTS